MPYRLEALNDLATGHGFATHALSDELVVTLAPDCAMTFAHLADGSSLVGFVGTPWHAHDTVVLEGRDGCYFEFDELDLLAAVLAGALLIVSALADGVLVDRWLLHPDLEGQLNRRPGCALVVHRLGATPATLFP